MRRTRSATLGALILVLPISVEVPTVLDSARTRGDETRITLAGGLGRYGIIDRGCEGQVIGTRPVRYDEAGGAIEHRFANGLALGVRGGAIHEEVEDRQRRTSPSTFRDTIVVVKARTSTSYVNPSVAFEGRSVGFGAGYISARDGFRSGGAFTDVELSLHLRIGSLDRTWFKLSYMEDTPLYGSGYFVIGIGRHLHRQWDALLGVGGGPYDGPGVAMRADYRVLPHLSIDGRVRLGHSGGEPQNGVGLGLTYWSRLAVDPVASWRTPDTTYWEAWPRRKPKRSRLAPAAEQPADSGRAR